MVRADKTPHPCSTTKIIDTAFFACKNQTCPAGVYSITGVWWHRIATGIESSRESSSCVLALGKNT